MKIVTADITGSLIVNGVDVTNNVVSSSVFSGSIAGRVTNLEQFSASLDATFATDASVTASILVLSQSVQASQAALSSSYALTSGSYVAVSASYLATSASYLTTSASYEAASSSLSVRVTNTEATASTNTQASASFAAQSASLSTRLTTDETNITTLTNASASFADQSASLSTRLTTDESNYTNLSSSFVTTSGSIAGRVTLIEGQYATTGSNTFTGPQFVSQASNAIGFTSTASLYTDGGLRVTKDSYVSGTAYFNNVVVYGTSSIQYITSSQVDIGANIITVNTDTPAVRFGGLAVYDSGSTQLTGSMLWDSERNHWVYSNPSGSTYSGGMLISGPRAASLGTEVGTTSCAMMIGQGGDHITSSAIFSYGNATCFYGQSFISASGDACFSGQVCSNTLSTSGTATFNGCVNINTGNQIRLYNSAKNNWVQIESPLVSGDSAIDFKLTTATGIVYMNSTGVACFNNAICAPRAELTSDASCVPLRLINGVITGGSTTGVTALYFGDAGSGVSMMQREKYAANQANLVLYSEYGYNIPSINACFGYNGVAFYTAGTKRQSIDGSGITCFSSNVCVGGELTINGSSINVNCSNTTATDARINMYARSATNGDRATIYGYNLAATTAGCEITYLAFGYSCTDNQGYINMQTKSGGAWCNTMTITNGRVNIGYTGVPAGTGKLFISRGDQYGLNINAQSGYVRIQGDDDLLAINRGGVDILSMSTCNNLGVRTTASPWAALRVCQCTSNNDYAVRVQAVFGINDYLDSDANRIFGGGLSETQFLNGSSSRPAMISLGGNLATSEALGVINFFRSDNASTYRSRAQIWAATNGSGCSTTLGGYITLTTADTGQTNPTQKLTIFSNGVACFACAVCAPRFQADNYGIFRASSFRGGLFTYDGVSGSGTDYSPTIFAEGGTGGGNFYITTGGSATVNMAMFCSGITCFRCQVCTPVLRASRVISNSTQIYDSDFSLNAGVTRSVVLCGGIYTLGDFHLMVYGNAGTGMSTIRLSTAGYFANSNLLQFCELQRYTFGSMTISGVSNNGTSISFNIGNCSGGSNGTGFWRMISLNGDAENNCIRVFVL